MKKKEKERKTVSVKVAKKKVSYPFMPFMPIPEDPRRKPTVSVKIAKKRKKLLH